MYRKDQYSQHTLKTQAHKDGVKSLLSSSDSDASPVFTSAASKALPKKPKRDSDSDFEQ
jgi:hypothetical protein